jgi:hypothetical protein
VQNWNFTIQRELFRDFTFDVRYVGNKGNPVRARREHQRSERLHERF